jgi:hypothetical protein
MMLGLGKNENCQIAQTEKGFMKDSLKMTVPETFQSIKSYTRSNSFHGISTKPSHAAHLTRRNLRQFWID